MFTKSIRYLFIFLFAILAGCKFAKEKGTSGTKTVEDVNPLIIKPEALVKYELRKINFQIGFDTTSEGYCTISNDSIVMVINKKEILNSHLNKISSEYSENRVRYEINRELFCILYNRDEITIYKDCSEDNPMYVFAKK